LKTFSFTAAKINVRPADHKLKRKEEEGSDKLTLVSQNNTGKGKKVIAEKNSADFS